MSGAYCIDFYNKSTLTFIVIYLCFSSCFLLHCHLLKNKGRVLRCCARICSFRVLLRQVGVPPPASRALEEAAAVWAWSYLFTLSDSRKVTESAPGRPAGLALWCGLCCSVLPREQTPSLARSCSSSSSGWSWGRAAPATAGLIIHCRWIHLQLMGSVWLGLYPWWFLSLKTSITAVTAVLVARIHSYYTQFCKPKRMLFFWTK